MAQRLKAHADLDAASQYLCRVAHMGNPSSKGYDALFWPVCATLSTVYTFRQLKKSRNVFNNILILYLSPVLPIYQ